MISFPRVVMTMNPIPFPRRLLSLALGAALAGCGDAAPPTTPALSLASNATPNASEQQMIDEIASTLQACSYDGSPLKVDPHGMAGATPGAGAEVVAEIMKFTGLPQNFDVIPHPKVPNAAALIVLGPDKLPRRVIAYNEGFMAEVRSATANNDWAPVSIMAHEIGHHLSGHTIQPGGSQPPTELEADKFSGFVLYRMGAALPDAQKALNTLVPEQDGPTHPGRGKRVRAIEEGWQQACGQQGAQCLAQASTPPAAATAATTAPQPASARTTTAAATPQPAVLSTLASTPSSAAPGAGASSATSAPWPGSAPVSRASTTVASTAATGPVDVLPAPDARAIPGKFGKFVVDELGVLDPATRTAAEQRLFQLAAEHQVEIVTLLVDSLHGLSADDYAQAMLRQLRVGKLDVGNGVVLVAAPKENQVGVAMGPGVRLEMRDYIDIEKDRLRGFLDIGLPYCKGVCAAEQSDLLLQAAEHIAQDVSHWDFNIRFQSLQELLSKFEETELARQNGAEIEPDQDPTWRKIVRFEGQLVSRDPAAGEQAKWINDVHAESVGQPVHVRSNGRNLLVYLDPHTEGLMTGRLQAGRNYVFIAREASLSQNPNDSLSFDLLSFDAAP